MFFCCSDSYTLSLPLLTLNFHMMNYNTLTGAQVHKSLTLFEMEIHDSSLYLQKTPEETGVIVHVRARQMSILMR